MIIPVNFKKATDESYEILIERGVLSKVGEMINLKRRVLVVTDSGVPAEYAQTVAAQCGSPYLLCIEQGEGSKSLDTFGRLLSVMLDASFTRRDCVVAVGGGVVGDISGFAASVYMRGIDFYNIPTTLLSQIDSSVGGKTAVNLSGVKNPVGSFYQPKKVMIDPDVLQTLDQRQFSSGLVEAIKMALTSDAQLFELIEQSENIRCDVDEVIARALTVKRNVVESDPKETGLRRVLNFGHTVGHAIEAYSNGTLYHGECVALGMLPMCAEEVRERLDRVLKKYNLPTEMTMSSEQLLPFMLHDKKAQSDGIVAVLTDHVGSFRFENMRAKDICALMDRVKD